MSSARKTVLVMDDSAIVRDTLAAVLEASGFAVRTAATLDELEAQRAACSPDLYILDVQMPEAFGDDVGLVLRDVQQVGVPILLFSSLDEKLLAQRASEAGLSGYVSKSAGLPALLARVGALLGGGSATP
jgi:DNA-binding response OmpR family regulator